MSAVLVESHAALVAARCSGVPSAVVMTMGALHEGHAVLVREARAAVGADGCVIVTDFVNPMQFGAGEDFERYPRSLEADVRICSAAGANLVYAPMVAEIYVEGAAGASITVDPGPLGEVLEGAARPGHFRGMLTVVAKLLHLTAPDLALFGEKDYQQLVLITEMVSQLNFPTKVVPVPTVREPDGLAMSSRNRYLSDEERAAAAVVPRALEETVRVSQDEGAEAGVRAGLAVLSANPAVEVDYLVVTDAALGVARPGVGRALVAVRVGTTRLLDNMACTVTGP
ncbi:MAG: pantoate--beta-alanine ligase [Actinobacteria bacterium]|uniref:pantoate--beta-alanine ligase (AMP-forming) n=1 Tax=freshwater metagenome TaxID=449393 RepID=A0A6J7J4F6_9ZZZZ|nr:pantoate--beta-alanine ligase [Actinomycetota bacterium]